MSKNKGVKKTLAVFMAVLMVMSCWVFTPISFEAAAVTSGTYYYKLVANVTNEAEWNTLNWTLYGKADNGSGTQSTLVNSKSYILTSKGDFTIFSGSSTSFPTSLKIYAEHNAAAVGRRLEAKLTLYVSANNSSWTVLPITMTEGSRYNFDTNRKITNNSDGSVNIDYENAYNLVSWKDNNVTLNATVKNANLPRANTIECSTQPNSSYTIPKTGTVTAKHVTYAKDQYGVKMTLTPTVSFTSDPTTGLTSSTSNVSANYTHSLAISNDAKMAGTTNSRKVTMTVSYKKYSSDTAKTCSHEFTIYDPQYTYTLDGNGGTIGGSATSATTKYYGNTFGTVPTPLKTGFTFKGFYTNKFDDSYDSVNYSGTPLASSTAIESDLTWYAAWQANKYNLTFKYRNENYEEKTITTPTYYGYGISSPEIPQTINVGVDYTYTFKAWDPAVPSTMPANDVTYTATYDVTTHYAELDGLKYQIASAESKMKEKLYVEGAYTAETVSALENALNTAEAMVNSKPLLSAQESVNETAKALENAIANLQIKKFTVLFVDESGAILKDGYHYVSYGDKVTVPTDPKKESDHEKHYTFSGWASGDSDALSACDYVIDDLKYIAKFTAEDHSFTPTTINSTCTTDGATEYTCSCGYSYTEANTADKAHHNFVEMTIKEATCSENGIKANVCSVCDVCEKASIVSIPKKSHTYSDWKTYTAATCAGEGVEYRECTCGAKEYQKTNKTAHSFGETTVVAPTCTAKGYSIHTCSMCGLIEMFAETEANGHNTTTNTVQPTCVSAGYEETKCGTCGHTTIKWLKATGSHSYGELENIVNASCVVPSVKKQTCTVCGNVNVVVGELGDHTWATEATIDYDSTCATEGQKSIHCAVCGQIKEGSKETIEKKPHTMGEAETVLEATCTGKGITKTVCGNCGYTVTTETNALGHAYGETSKTDATCTTDGKLVETCSKCNDVKETVIPKTGHNYVAGTPVAATCKDAAHVTMTCACGDSYVKYTGAPTLNHYWQVTSTTTHDKTTVTSKCSICNAEVTQEIAGSHKFTEGEVTTTPTCTTDGIVTVKCEVEGCGESYTINIGKGSHTIETQVTEPDCVNTGKAVSYCTTCNETISEATIKAKGHNYTAKITKEATCTAKGVITYTCACGDEYTGKIEENPNAHEFKKNGETVKATCTSPAYDEYKCACRKTYKEYSGEALGHKYTTTSTQSGTTLTVTCECSVCHDKHEYTTSVAEGHNYSVATVTIEPTCHTKGEVEISCDKAHDVNCDSSIKVELAVNSDAHNFNTTYNYPTCEAEGSVVTTCVNGCGYVSTAKLSALGHVWNEGAVTTEPTCTTDGEKTFACTRTGCDETRTEVIAKTGHSWNTGTNHAADCTHGQYTHYECTACHETYDAVVDGAKALGHEWDDGEVTTEPTCTTDGEKTFTCTRKDCGETRTEPIGKLGHNFVEGTEHTATCDTAAYTEYKCNNSGCTLSYNEYKDNALGHDWGEWTVTTPATNDADGVMTRTCSRDSDHTETVTIPKGGHTFDTENPTTVTAATCTTEGEQTFACTAHDDCGVTLTVTTAKIQHELTTVYTEANCTTGGSVVTACENCDYKDTITLSALGHDYVKGAHVDATCTSSGYDVYTCSRCGDVKNVIDEETAIVGHQWKEVANSNTATCVNAGTAEYECSACHTKLTVNTTALGHDYSVKGESKEATCNSVGYTVYKCSRCENTHTEYAEKLGNHNFGEWTTVQTATDVLPGIKVRKCSVCEKYEYEYTAPTGAHVWNDGEEVEVATCEADGKKHYTCIGTDCECTDDNRATYDETIPAKGHDKYLDFVDATCDTDGHATVKCHNCVVVFSTETVAAKGHTYGETPTSKVAPTCSNNGKLVYGCENCTHEETIIIDKIPSAHNWVKNGEQTADCTHAGYETYECSYCNDTYMKHISDPTPHTVDDAKTDTKVATCNEAGYVKKYCSCGQLMSTDITPLDQTKHDWKTKTAEGSGCLKSGYSYSECSVCGKITDITVTESADHTYTQKVKTAATCTAGGEIEIYCTTCEAVVQTVTTLPLGHDFSGEPTVTPATCKNAGSVVYSCQRTDCDEKLTYTLDKTPHSYVLKNTVAATCTQGSYELFECGDCGSLMKNVTSSANGHSYEADPSNADVEATCCAEGHVYRKCKNCDAKYDYVVPATGEHTYDDGTVTQEATCLKSEITKYKCTTDGCSASYEKVTADAKGHNYTDWTYAHMTATGKCACGDTITVNIPDSATHSWVYDKISSPATCNTKGYIQFKCEVEGCDATLYREYGPIDGAHVWNDGETTTEATCTTDGVKTYTCTKCNTTKTETIAKLGHEHTSLVEKVDPTCTANGYVTYKCIRCDDKVTSIIEKNADNHKFVTVTVDPTCLEDGYTVETCEYCGHEGTKTVNENTALGHNEVTNETKATCVKAGSKITYCDRCNTIIKTESSAALGHDENRTNITPATCEGTGKDHVTCSRCDYEADETVDALGHDWNDGEIIVTGNCETQQVTRYTCKRCGDTKDVLTGEIAKHNYEYKGVVAPTCTEKGYDKWVCSKCDDVNKRNLVDALGHDWGDWRIVSYPTETENGLQERFCQRDGCGAREEQIIIYGKFYLVTFYNYDGTRLMPPAYYEYGAPAIRPRKNPVKAADTAYTYEFIGWNYSDKQIGFVSERMAIIAQYAAHERYYDVTYKNEDGSVLATVKNVGFSQIAAKYPNPTPTKASDSSYDYTFGSWSINCDTNKGEAIATATYKSTPKKYEPPADTGSSSEENLFTRIINWIKNFFNKLFGRG